MKQKKWILGLSASLLLLVLLLALLLTGALDLKPEDLVPDLVTAAPLSDDEAQTQADFPAAFSVDATVQTPLLPLSAPGYFYTITKTGEVSFYKQEGVMLTQLPAAGSYSLSVSCSREVIPCTVSYIEIDGSPEGCGLFTNSDAENTAVRFYEYAFFKLCALPEPLREDGKLLLLVDVEPARLYTEKRYGECFRYDPVSGTVTDIFSQAQRSFDRNARMRADYAVLTDALLRQTKSPFRFLSSRMYTLDSGKADIYTMGYVDEYNSDNTREVSDVLGSVFYPTGDGIRYWRTDADGTGFSLRDADGVLASFSGSFAQEYLLSDGYLLEKQSGALYSVASQRRDTLDYAGFGAGFTVQTFAVSENGRYAAVLAAVTDGTAALGFYDLQAGKSAFFTSRQFAHIVCMYMSDDGVFLASVAQERAAQNCRVVLWTF